MDVKGILNKRLTRVILEEDIDLPCDVFTEESSKKAVGKITSKAHTPQGIMGLAILRKTVWEDGKKLLLQKESHHIKGTTFEPETVE